MNPAVVVVLLMVGSTCYGFNDIQDGARILGNDEINKIAESYSIPSRKKAFSEPQQGVRASIARRLDGVPFGYDDEEFSLLSRMKTMEIPPSVDAVNYYSQKYANYPSGSSRFALSRRVRSTSGSGGLKFDDKSTSASSGPRGPPGGPPPSSPVNFNGDKPVAGAGGKEPTEENKRLFPELFGLGGPGYYGGHYPYHPTAGYYPGGNYGHGGYYPGFQGAGFHHGYPSYHPGGVGGASSSSASASASSSGGGLHHRPVNGLYGNGYYGNGGGGYYPPGGVAPILGAGGPAYGPGFVGGGFFREDGKGGKVSGTAVSTASDSSGGNKVNGGSVSFGS